MKRLYLYLLFLFLLPGNDFQVIASHIVGGEVTYRCLGGDRYEITVTTYRDCVTGDVGAIRQDDPALISIYDGAGILMDTSSIFMSNPGGTRVPPNFKNDCVTNVPYTCLNSAVFVRVYTLPANTTGYKVIYQRCCRNQSVVNLADPFNTGATYYCTIPPSSVIPCNNSAVFSQYPPQIICINNPLVYDHSAIDPDGDSLSYEFCTAYDTPPTDPDKKVYPSNRYDPVRYQSPYSAARPVGGDPRLQINEKTGIITGKPIQLGRFVVTVCCHEWRNGQMISTTRRDFQFTVTNCSKAVVADIPQYSSEFNTYIVNCKDYTVTFDNTSKGGSTYHWDFGVKDRLSDTSDQFQPTYTYPDSGTFVVTLYVNPGSTCGDSISRFVKVYPKLKIGYDAMSPVCPGDTVQFTDKTTSTYDLNSWSWNFDDGSPIDKNQHTYHVFRYGGLYNVGFIASNVQGCVDTIYHKILVDPFMPVAGVDTMIVQGEKINFQARGGANYNWSPGTYLSDTNISNPVGSYPDLGTFTYLLRVTTEIGCVGYDTIKIRVIDGSRFDIPNAFTPNGDGINDVFRPSLVGYTNIRYLKIYNRYGEQVYYTTNISDGWDGTYKGQEAEMGVYYWLLGVRNRFNEDEEKKGDVTLIR